MNSSLPPRRAMPRSDRHALGRLAGWSAGRSRPLLVTLSLLCLAIGCGGPDGPVRVAVSGQVTLDGAPLTSGVIRFIPQTEAAGPAASLSIVGGQFTSTAADGPVIGTHRVEIEAVDHQGFAIDDEAAFSARVEQTGQSPLACNPIPVIYNSASTLTATVTEADNPTFQFALSTQHR